MNFSEALIMLKKDNALRRSGWNAKDQYIYYIPANEYPSQTDIARKQFGEKVPYTAYLAIKTVQNTVAPWLASQTDLLAEDWDIVE